MKVSGGATAVPVMVVPYFDPGSFGCPSLSSRGRKCIGTTHYVVVKYSMKVLGTDED